MNSNSDLFLIKWHLFIFIPNSDNKFVASNSFNFLLGILSFFISKLSTLSTLLLNSLPKCINAAIDTTALVGSSIHKKPSFSYFL